MNHVYASFLTGALRHQMMTESTPHCVSFVAPCCALRAPAVRNSWMGNMSVPAQLMQLFVGLEWDCSLGKLGQCCLRHPKAKMHKSLSQGLHVLDFLHSDMKLPDPLNDILVNGLWSKSVEAKRQNIVMLWALQRCVHH